jgi:hypothetical protein
MFLVPSNRNVDGSSSSTSATIGPIIDGSKTFNGDVTFNGNVSFNGTTTTIDSTATEIKDNTILLNRGASGVTDTPSGIILENKTNYTSIYNTSGSIYLFNSATQPDFKTIVPGSQGKSDLYCGNITSSGLNLQLANGKLIRSNNTGFLEASTISDTNIALLDTINIFSAKNTFSAGLATSFVEISTNPTLQNNPSDILTLNSGTVQRVSASQTATANSVVVRDATREITIKNAIVEDLIASRILLTGSDGKLSSSSYTEDDIVLKNVDQTINSIKTFGANPIIKNTAGTARITLQGTNSSTGYSIASTTNADGLFLYDHINSQVLAKFKNLLTNGKLLSQDTNGYIYSTGLGDNDIATLAGSNTFTSAQTFSSGISTSAISVTSPLTTSTNTSANALILEGSTGSVRQFGISQANVSNNIVQRDTAGKIFVNDANIATLSTDTSILAADASKNVVSTGLLTSNIMTTNTTQSNISGAKTFTANPTIKSSGLDSRLTITGPSQTTGYSIRNTTPATGLYFYSDASDTIILNLPQSQITAGKFLQLNALSMELASTGYDATNFVQTTGNQNSIAGNKTFTGTVSVDSLSFGTVPSNNATPSNVLTLNSSSVTSTGISSSANGNSIVLRDASGNFITNSINVSATTDQLTFGPTSGNTTILRVPIPAGNRTYTIPDISNSTSEILLSYGTQDIFGAKTFRSNPVILNTSDATLVLRGTNAATGYTIGSTNNTSGVYIKSGATTIVGFNTVLTSGNFPVITTDGYLTNSAFTVANIARLNATSQTISGTNTFSGTVNFSSLTGNTFLTLDGSRNVISTIFNTVGIARTTNANNFLVRQVLTAGLNFSTLSPANVTTGSDFYGLCMQSTTGDVLKFLVSSAATNDSVVIRTNVGDINGNKFTGTNLALTNNTNQIAFGTTNIVTLSTSAQSTSQILNIPTLSTNDTLMTLATSQTISGNKTFSGTVNLSTLTANTFLTLDGSKNVVSTSFDTTNIARTNVNNTFTGPIQTIRNTTVGQAAELQLWGNNEGLGISLYTLGIADGFNIYDTSNNGRLLANFKDNGTINELNMGNGSSVSSIKLKNSASFTSSIRTTSTAADRIYTIPESGANADFVMTQGTQTINGTKTLAGTINFSALTANNILALDASKNVVSTAFDTTNIARTNANNVFTGPTQTIRNTTVGQAAELQLRGNNEGLGISLYTLGIADGFNIYDTSNNGRLLANFKDNGAINELNMGNGSSISSVKLKNSASFTSSIRTAATTTDRIYTLPEAGANADFVMTAGNQTIAGNKTFSGQVIISRYAIATGIILSFQFISPNSTDTILFNAYTSNGITTTTFPYGVFDTNAPGVYLITWTLRTMTAPTAETSTWIECSEDTAIKHGLQAIPIGSFYCSSSVLIPLVNSNSNFRVKFFNGNASNITVSEIDARLTIRYINSN